MDFIQAIIMGIVQGLSEFLPISSSAHLVFSSNFYKVFKGISIAEQSNQEVFFDIMLHLGTLIAVIIFFRKEFYEIFKAIFNFLKKKEYDKDSLQIGYYIIIGTFITMLIGYPLHDIAESLVFLPSVVGLLLIGTGILLLSSEYYLKKYNNNEKLDLKKSILIGIAQGLATFPGFSRSGLTMATALFAKTNREVAARYSFLLSMPIILLASMVYPAIKLNYHEVITYNWSAIIAGTIVSGIVGYICIKYFMLFISKFSLNVFGWYCVIAGIITSIFFALV